MDGGETARVAVITGATGGTGAAVARELSRAGYSLVLTAPSMEKLSALAAQLKGPCMVIEGSLVKVIAWDDNEWGYSNRVVELAQRIL